MRMGLLLFSFFFAFFCDIFGQYLFGELENWLKRKNKVRCTFHLSLLMWTHETGFWSQWITSERERDRERGERIEHGWGHYFVVCCVWLPKPGRIKLEIPFFFPFFWVILYIYIYKIGRRGRRRRRRRSFIFVVLHKMRHLLRYMWLTFAGFIWFGGWGDASQWVPTGVSGLNFEVSIWVFGLTRKDKWVGLNMIPMSFKALKIIFIF